MYAVSLFWVLCHIIFAHIFSLLVDSGAEQRCIIRLTLISHPAPRHDCANTSKMQITHIKIHRRKMQKEKRKDKKIRTGRQTHTHSLRQNGQLSSVPALTFSVWSSVILTAFGMQMWLFMEIGEIYMDCRKFSGEKKINCHPEMEKLLFLACDESIDFTWEQCSIWVAVCACTCACDGERKRRHTPVRAQGLCANCVR